MFCEKCGNELAEGEMFCEKCGAARGEDNASGESSAEVIGNVEPGNVSDNNVLISDSNYLYKKKRRKRTLLGFIIGIVLIFAVFAFICSFDFDNFLDLFEDCYEGGVAGLCLGIPMTIWFLGLIVEMICNKARKQYTIEVTETDICKVFKKGLRIDIPFDTVTLAKATEWGDGILVYARKLFKFKRLGNRDAVYNVICECLNNRQREAERIEEERRQQQAAEAKERAAEAAKKAKEQADEAAKKAEEEAAYREKVLEGLNAAKSNTADEIRSFKELMDQGIISSEEFEAKKKQLLGL